MQNLPAENMPLLPTPSFPSSFQKLIINPLKKFWKNLTFKSLGIAVTSAVSVITYYNPAYEAGASLAAWLKEFTAASGVGTNFFLISKLTESF